MEKTLNDLMGSEHESLPHDRNALLRQRLPFGLDADEVPVRNFTRTAYNSLKTLNLRETTGATVLAIERRDGVVHNPHPDMPLLPNDRIVLVGSRDQLDRARVYLNERAQPSDPIVERDLRIPASSPAVGHPLGELHLMEETGARLGLVRRSDGTLHAPSDRLRREPDDHVVVYGPEASMERARERLRVREFREPRPRVGPAGR